MGCTKKIVLTGGPCAGKTTILEELQKDLTEKGYYVITIDETATQFIKRKMPPREDREETILFQDMILKMQILKERQATIYAETFLKDENVVILCDRGILDNSVYVNECEDFDYILKNNELDEQEVIHSYDFVIDLISTATSKKDAYELDGVRSEPVELAALLDKKTTLAWIDHPKLLTIHPTEDIEDKKKIVLSAVNDYLNGIEYNNRITMMLSKNDMVYNKDNCRVVDVNKIYLKDDLVITHKKSGNFSVCILGKYNDSFSDRIISSEEFANYIYSNPAVFSERTREVYFSDMGYVYTIVENGDKKYLTFDSNAVKTAEEALSVVNKCLVKKYN